MGLRFRCNLSARDKSGFVNARSLDTIIFI